MTAYEQARWLIATAQIAWLTTYDDCFGRLATPLGFVGSPVDVAEDPTGRLVLALPNDDPAGHLARLARVPVGTLLICAPPTPGFVEDIGARVVLHGRVCALGQPTAVRLARAALAKAHEYIDPEEIVPVTLEPAASSIAELINQDLPRGGVIGRLAPTRTSSATRGRYGCRTPLVGQSRRTRSAS